MPLDVDNNNAMANNFDNKTIDDNIVGDNAANLNDITNQHRKSVDKEPLENGEDDIDPFDLIANCNEIGGDLISDNSDVWKCSDTDEESFTNQKDVDNHLIDNTEMNLIDDNGIKECNTHNETNTDCLKQNENDVENKNKIDEEHKDINSPESNENKTTDDLDDNQLNNENSTDNNTIVSVNSAPNENKMTDNLDNNQLIDRNKEDAIQSPENNETTDESKTIIINDKKGDDSGDSGISDTITQSNIENNDKNLGNEENDNDEMDYNDFDPSLLCPEVSMAVDDAQVITENTTNNDCTSPLPYERLFSTYVDEITGAEISFNLTPEEQDTRSKRYTNVNPVEYTRIHCTACNIHLGSALEAQNNRFVHPLLKVLICKRCYNFYTSGEFEKDEDGSELYCRWCGQGGQVLCCSKCECVFCKKCIKTNFGRRKLNEIKDSDDWVCFKCNPSKLTYQRIACFELFEYVRRETARAATLNDPEFLSTDYSVCCKIKQTDILDTDKEKKKTKKKKNEDPEYDPLEENQPATKKIKIIAPKVAIPLNNNNNNNNNNNSNNISNFISPITTITSTPTILHPSAILLRPSSTIIQTSTSSLPINNLHRPQIINSQNFRQSIPALVRINTTNQITTLTPTIVTTTPTTQQSLFYRTLDISEHEWFEKTVRSTARVNSHLSYTLTQLNKVQSQAGSLEELAVVHNKLQEVLSSSINSLIQIRKNLRSEFITGIKKVRLPARKFDCSTNKIVDDDDVIFVSAAPSTITLSRPVLIAKTNASSPSTTSTINNNNNNINEDSATNNDGRPKGFLKVKSVLELQNVPSECITIPDEPSPSNCDDTETQSVVLTEKNDGNIETKSEIVEKTERNTESSLSNDLNSNNNEIQEDSTKDETPPPPIVKEQESKITDVRSFKYNLNDPPTPEVKRMKLAYVRVERSPLIK